MDKTHILSLIRECKLHPQAHELTLAGALSGLRLRPLGPCLLSKPEIVELLTAWRRSNQHAYPTIFNVTVEGTRRWVQARVIDDAERILFGIFDGEDRMIAHAGLATFDWQVGDVEIDNVMRGDAGHKGLMTAVTNRLVQFAYDGFAMKTVSLKVFGDNYRAIQLYQRCGFRPVGSIPMGCEMSQNEIRWVAQSQFISGQTFRIFLRMSHEHAHEKRVSQAA